MTILRRNIIANFAGQGWAALMALAFTPVYIQYLGIEAYGLIGLFVVLQTWLSLLDMGFGQTLGREMARFTAGFHTPQSIGNLLRSLEVIVYTVAILIAFVVWNGGEWLANDWLRVEKMRTIDVSRALSVTALVVGMRFVEGMYRNAIFGLQRQVWFNCVHAILSTLRYGGVIVILAFVSPTILAFFMWQALISLVTLSTYAFKVHRLLPKSPAPTRASFSSIKSVMGFTGGILGINFLAVVLSQVDKLLLSRLLSLEAFGYYMVAAAVVGGLSLVIGPITQALYPRMVELVTEKDDLNFAQLYHQGAQLVSLSLVSIISIIFLFPEGVLYLWSGDMALAVNSAPIMAPMALGTFLNGLMWMPYQSQLANGWTSLGVVVNFCAVCLFVPAIFLFVPIYGAVAAAWIWVALNVVYVLLVVHVMHRRILLGEKFRWYSADIIRPASGVIVLLLILKYMVTPELDEMNRLDWLPFLLVAGIAAFLVSLRLCDQIWPLVRATTAEAVRKAANQYGT